MEFSLSEEQKLIIDTTKKFVETELFPHEDLVEKTGNLPLDLIKEIQLKAILPKRHHNKMASFFSMMIKLLQLF